LETRVLGSHVPSVSWSLKISPLVKQFPLNSINKIHYLIFNFDLTQIKCDNPRNVILRFWDSRFAHLDTWKFNYRQTYGEVKVQFHAILASVKDFFSSFSFLEWGPLGTSARFGLLYQQGKLKYSEKTCSSAILSTTNPTWPDLGSNTGRRGGKPATNCLSYVTARDWR
jgi:hypothetical protein